MSILDNEPTPEAGANTPDAISNQAQQEVINEMDMSGVNEWLHPYKEAGELIKDPTLKNFTGVPDLIKGYVNAQKMVGSKLVVPKEDAPKDQWNDFYKKLGVPDFDEYKIDNQGIDNQDYIDSFRKAAHEAGLMTKQAQSLFNWQKQYVDSMTEKQSGMQEASIEAAKAELHKKWGKDFDTNVAMAKLAVNSLDDGGAFKTYLDETGLSNDANVIEALSHFGSSMVDKSVVAGDSGNTLQDSKESSKEWVENVWADKKHPYFDKRSPLHAKAKKEMRLHLLNAHS